MVCVEPHYCYPVPPLPPSVVQGVIEVQGVRKLERNASLPFGTEGGTGGNAKKKVMLKVDLSKIHFHFWVARDSNPELIG